MTESRFGAHGALVLFLSLFLASSAYAADTGAVSKMDEVLVTAEAEQGVEALPDVQGAKIYSGKKTTVVRSAAQPQVQNNVYRQAFSRLPGLLVAEQNNHGHVNMNYRGVGDPHESQDLLTLKDGLPIGMERYGYSTTYYVPPFEAVERIEFIRGGSALLYGPQPGPALNYVTYMPPKDRSVTAGTQHIFGSEDLYTTFNHVGGTVGRMGYLGYFHHSESDGQRANEDFEVNGGSLKLTLDGDTDARWVLNLDIHEKDSGEPGRLTLPQFRQDRFQTLRPFDELRTDRYAASLSFERDLSEQTLWTTTLYGGYFDRFSLRRTTNTSNLNNLDRREVYSGGLESRLRHEYQAFGSSHTFTGGVHLYGSDAPRTQDRSTTYPSESGNPIFDFDYHTGSASVFGENEFNFGRLSVSPAFRAEFIEMDVRENFNVGKTSPLHDIEETYGVPLFGIGAEYELTASHELYANASQGYKPPQFDDLAPSGNNTLPATDLEEGHTWTYEAGVRGNPVPWASYDASAFLTDYENYFGTVTVGTQTQRRNVGDAEYHGVELAGEADLFAFADTVRGGKAGENPLGSLSLYGSASFLSAEFTGGPFTGKEPAYAPNYVVKSGLVYRFLGGRGKVALMGTFVEDHYWADNNLAGGTGLTAIPAYEVWDLTSEFLVYRDSVKVFFGVGNLSDEVYFSRVRADGIEPAQERNYYGGARFVW
jgi:Fe(3+) dicitrate transport protein